MSSITCTTEERMNKCIDNLKENFTKIRTGRANPHILDSIQVDYYGVPTPVVQLAAIKVPEATTLVVEPWDKSALKPLEAAIQASDLGINPANDGVSLRLSFPSPTQERRLELVKECKSHAEEARVAVRNVRRDMNGKVERDPDLNDDEKHREQSSIQTITDKHIAEIDALLKHKEAEVLEV